MRRKFLFICRYIIFAVLIFAPKSLQATQPTSPPSSKPSKQPSCQPTSQPSSQPTSGPSKQPSTQPSNQPTSQPSVQPRIQPSSQPSLNPTRQPSCQPTFQPSSQPNPGPSKQQFTQPFNQSNSVSFTTPGTYSWVVPSGVASILVSLQGADGGLCNSAKYSAALPGNGSAVSATLTVKAGSVLYINVGGQGGLAFGGYNGGGNGGSLSTTSCSTGGGGATDIRLSASNLTTRLIVAGGGGGNYGACYSTGGNGGYPSGESASRYAKTCGWSINRLAGAGTQTAGGVGGRTDSTFVGYPGSFGDGGSGYEYYSGGGGGGYYGGGGGAYSGGGGGSSYCGPACSDVSYSEGTCCGNGSVVILLNYPNTPSGNPTIKRTNSIPTARLTVIPTKFVPPSRMNYYLYNGKYYSTLSDVNVNNPSTTCQSTYYTLPMDWILASGDSDSLQVISLNTWSTSTVVVASGDGYYSKSSYGLRNNAVGYWLYTSYSIYGNSYTCAICNCQVLIMYSPLKPSYSPVSYISPSFSTTSSSSSSSGDFLGTFLGTFFGVFFLMLGFMAYHHYQKNLRQRSQQIHAQPTTQEEDSAAVVHHDQPADRNNSYYTNDMGMQPQPVAFDLRATDSGNVQQQQQQQQPYRQIQPGYIQMQPLQVNQIQADQPYAYEYLQPQPQGYGRYGQPQPQPQQPVYNYVQTQQLVYGYVQPQLQEQPQVYAMNNSQFLQPQHQPQPQSGYSPAPQPAQQSGGFEYYAQPQQHDPNIVHPAMAVPMYNDHIVHVPPVDMYAQQQPSHIEGSFSPKA